MTRKIDLFKGRKLVIATMHSKEKAIAPLLEKHLGVEIVIPENFDTDRFGTFTREVKRAGNQLEAATKKLIAAMDLTGVDLGVSSEGSFGPDTSSPFGQSNFELIVFIDRKNGFEVCGHYQTPKTNIDGKYVTSAYEALEFAKGAGFPRHGVVIRSSKNGHRQIHKGIDNEEELARLVEKMLKKPFSKRVFIESDMRAHKNPTRMKAIEAATKDLLKNVLSLCPECKAPGFAVYDYVKGLKCSLCSMPTDLPLYEAYQCKKCNYSEKRKIKIKKLADPSYCKYCNP